MHVLAGFVDLPRGPSQFEQRFLFYSCFYVLFHNTESYLEVPAIKPQRWIAEAMLDAIQLNKTKGDASVFRVYVSSLNKRNPTVRERTMAARDGNGGNPGPVT